MVDAKMLPFLIATALLGCSTPPPRHESGDEKKFSDIARIETLKAETAIFQLPKTPEPGKALVYVVRPGSRGFLQRFNIFVDGQDAESNVGYTFPDQYIYFNLQPGTHKIYSDAENWSETIVRAEEGRVIFLEQRTQSGLLASTLAATSPGLLTAIIGDATANNFLVEINEQEGKSRLKALTFGTVVKTEK